MTFIAYLQHTRTEHDESHESDPNSDITDPSDLESDTELESDLDSNHMGADSSFNASTSTKVDQRNFQWNRKWKSFPGSTTTFWRRDASIRTANYSQQPEAEMLLIAVMHCAIWYHLYN